MDEEGSRRSGRLAGEYGDENGTHGSKANN